MANIMAPFTKDKMKPHDLRSVYTVRMRRQLSAASLLPGTYLSAIHTAYDRFKPTGMDSFLLDLGFTYVAKSRRIICVVMHPAAHNHLC
jgi:hypothetical protein